MPGGRILPSIFTEVVIVILHEVGHEKYMAFMSPKRCGIHKFVPMACAMSPPNI